ncbi:putative transcription factor C2C2-CO-like family [Rosa chinensis]|uniref:Putative transcription factor C2C2-CO-like family n=1 Tax=Rosa chinensis TaxID=74649 RepID=A0A2P6QTN4_ROSCH|nr:zinc finger protein CONSTANS-LIKE 5 [Rosa chinensis]PRQ37551.1 putative transcription factor C2C2-CO-like family [Rosa chinensis]
MGLQAGWTLPGLTPKPCDTCKSSPSAVFCRADSAYLCLTCDSKIHCANKLASRHQRVWMCEVCEQAPAAVTCKADAAALCVTCDADIHSANPLARRHERVPVEPFLDSAESIVKSTSAVGLSDAASSLKNDDADSLLIPNLNFSSKFIDALDIKPGDMFFPEMESLFELDYPNPIQNSSSGMDSVVPVQPDPIPPPPVVNQPPRENCFDIDFCRNKLSSSFSYPAQSISQSVSSSSLDVGVVPDGNSLSDISYPFIRNVNHNGVESGVAAAPATATAIQLSGVDREARVMRYREKRKNRKFQKTIRYASRKAYAETRPRIKGRFAKRTETETEVMDRIFNSAPGSYIADAQYGVVPTF